MVKKKKRHQVRIANQRPGTANEAYYKKLKISGFRGFSDFELDGLASVNLLFGRNNCGKTSLLEAIYSHACGHNFGPFLQQVILKRQEGIIGGHLDFGEKLRSIFHTTSSIPYSYSISAELSSAKNSVLTRTNFEPSTALADLDPLALGQYVAPSRHVRAQLATDAVDIAGSQLSLRTNRRIPSISLGKWTIQSEGKRTEIEIQFPPVSPPSATPFKLGVMHDLLAHRPPETEARVYSFLKRYDMLSDFVAHLTEDFPEIRSIDMIPYPDGSQGPVYAFTNDDRRIPLWAFGDGMRRWFYLLGHMFVYRDACHCIEEIDATFHPAAHKLMSRLLISYAQRFHNQLFLTTHSIEFADSFLDALYGEEGTVSKDEVDPLAIFSLRPDENTTNPIVWTSTGRDAYAKRKKFELELR